MHIVVLTIPAAVTGFNVKATLDSTLGQQLGNQPLAVGNNWFAEHYCICTNASIVINFLVVKWKKHINLSNTVL